MISKLEEMMSRYPTETLLDKENALKETCQDILLYGLSKTNFFASAAMYGGTAMRLFLGLDRFSEDLDFTLKENKPDFSWDPYLPTLRKVLASFGLGGDITVKEPKGYPLVHLPRRNLCLPYCLQPTDED
jgi:predicted nucleotidyltransferase component of viral defense system